jgi:hypothetical protein
MNRSYWARVGSRPIRRARAEILAPRPEIRRTVVRPNRWAAEPAGERPYGLRPYEAKQAQAIASLVLAPRLTETQHIRDLRDGIYDREIRARKLENARNVRHPHPRFAAGLLSIRFACGIRQLEIEGINAMRANKTHGCYRPATEHEEGFVDTVSFDDCAVSKEVASGFGYQDVTAEVESLRKRLREQRKAGRKPLGAIAMSSAERVRKHRDAKKRKAPATPGRLPAGAVQPLPLGLTAPVILFDRYRQQASANVADYWPRLTLAHISNRKAA